MTAKRYQSLNFIYPFAIGQFGFIIPKPIAETNYSAVWNPFQQQVKQIVNFLNIYLKLKFILIRFGYIFSFL